LRGCILHQLRVLYTNPILRGVCVRDRMGDESGSQQHLLSNRCLFHRPVLSGDIGGDDGSAIGSGTDHNHYHNAGSSGDMRRPGEGVEEVHHARVRRLHRGCMPVGYMERVVGAWRMHGPVLSHTYTKLRCSIEQVWHSMCGCQERDKTRLQGHGSDLQLASALSLGNLVRVGSFQVPWRRHGAEVQDAQYHATREGQRECMPRSQADYEALHYSAVTSRLRAQSVA